MAVYEASPPTECQRSFTRFTRIGDTSVFRLRHAIRTDSPRKARVDPVLDLDGTLLVAKVDVLR